MLLDNIRLGQQSREQLIRLKRITGIENWNILCRWAFCLSLADRNAPPHSRAVADAGVEMSWKTFAGEHADIYGALLLQRAHEEGTITDRNALSELLRNHIVRGIGLLTARRDIESIRDLIRLIY